MNRIDKDAIKSELFKNLPVEFQLMLAFLQPSYQDEQIIKINRLCRLSPDWNLFFILIGHHGVFPLIYKRLSAITGVSFPENIFAKLRKLYQQNAYNVLNQTTELIRLMRIFHECQIQVIPLKGPILSLQAYGDLAMRPSGDLDLFFTRRDSIKAEKILINKGYRYSEYEIAGERKHMYRNLAPHTNLIHPDKNITVELHWGLTPPPFNLKQNFHDIWDNQHVIKVADTSVACMPHDLLVIYLCIHGANHGWYRLICLYDVAKLIRNMTWSSILRILAFSQKIGRMKMVLQGLLLSHFLLNETVPFRIFDLVSYHQYNSVIKTAIRIMVMAHDLSIPYRPFTPYYRARNLFRFQVCENTKERLKYLVMSLGPPRKDIVDFPLPELFFWMYYIMRPFLWFKRLFSNP